MTREEALAQWEEARDASQKAREALLSAKQKVREAESHFNSCWDTERSRWLALQHHQAPIVLPVTKGRRKS